MASLMAKLLVLLLLALNAEAVVKLLSKAGSPQ